MNPNEKSSSLAGSAAYMRVVTVFLLLSIAGCRSLQLRPVRPAPVVLSREEVIDVLYERTHFFTTLTDTDISLRFVHETQEATERSPSLSGVMAFDRVLPGLWLRAERFRQNVFTLRARSMDFWLEIPDSREVITGGRSARNMLPFLLTPDEVLLWFTSPEELGLTWEDTTFKLHDGYYLFEVRLNGFLLRTVSVDMYSKNVKSIVDFDVHGNVATSVAMDRYRKVNGSVFPHRFVVSRPDEGYELTLQLRRPEFGRKLPPETFQPRPRPGWEHINLDRKDVERRGNF